MVRHPSSRLAEQPSPTTLLVFSGEDCPSLGGDVGTVPRLVVARTRTAGTALLKMARQDPGRQGQQPCQHTRQQRSRDLFHVPSTT